MSNKKAIVERQALHAVEHGEFPEEVIASNDRVVVIMTQDWCSQWLLLNLWIRTIRVAADVDLYELVYNRVDYFEEFLRLKEERWGNEAIPYLRSYRDGRLVGESNYLGRGELKELLTGG